MKAKPMNNLTKLVTLVHNGLDLVPYIMGGRQLVFGAALAAGLGAASEAAADNHIPGLEHLDPTVAEKIATNYRGCIQEALDLSNNGDGTIDADFFAISRDLCDESMVAEVRSANASVEIAAITDNIIAQMKREEGIVN